MSDTEQAWLPDLVYVDGTFQSGLAIVLDSTGIILRVAPADEVINPIRLKDRALLPGLINAHSHAFQRVIRGRTEHRSQNTDSFWTWREQMYAAANKLGPDDIYTASRMCFLEMALTGITAVGEFHYIHHAPGGKLYDDPNLLAMEVVRAAQDVGIRIALLRVAYARSGYDSEPNPLQVRFIEKDPEKYLANVQKLAAQLGETQGLCWVGIAPHSVRAVPLPYLKTIIDFGNEREWPIHMHVAEQPAEVSACIEEYGRSPVSLLNTEGLLSRHFCAVHAIHVTTKAIEAIAESGATVCACPTTERNLGDGVIPVDGYLKEHVPVSLGTDSQIQIDLLEDARELEYHLRLQRKERNVLAPWDDLSKSALARRLFKCATVNGAESIGFASGKLDLGLPGDFFTVDLNDPSIAGAREDDLLARIVFSLSRTAVREVVVGGRQIIEAGQHPLQNEIVRSFADLQRQL